MSDHTFRIPIPMVVTEDDLADADLFGPAWIQVWLDAHQPPANARAADEAAHKARAEQAQVAALAEWETLRAKLTDTPQGNALRELLDVHKPELWTYSHRGPVCGYCDQIGGPERDGVDWPCVNYEIIRDGIG